MGGQYQAVKPPRFEIEQGLGGERIRIGARRRIFILIFLPIWLVGWTIGGVSAFAQFLRGGEPFLAIWLCGWTVAWLAVFLALAWSLWGVELIGVVGGDLEVGESLLGFTRMRLYRGSDVSDLAAAGSPPMFGRGQLTIPFIVKPRFGAVKFNYGGRTVYTAQGLDEAEGRMIVERLLRRLPKGTGAGI
jgi:hypothetical protein